MREIMEYLETIKNKEKLQIKKKNKRDRFSVLNVYLILRGRVGVGHKWGNLDKVVLLSIPIGPCAWFRQ